MSQSGITGGYRSPEGQVLLHPIRAYRQMAQEPADAGLRVALRRPLFLAILLGSVVSLTTSGHLTLRLIVGAAFSWSFVPGLQIVAAVALAFLASRPLTLSRTIDLYFMGHAPWSLWLLAIAAFSTLVSPMDLHAWTIGATAPLPETLVIPFLWSTVITFGLLRGALGVSVRRAIVGVMLNAVILWGAVILFFLLTDQLWHRFVRSTP